MESLKIRNGSGNINASIVLPASKSISNRLLIIKDLCRDEFEIDNLSESDDTLILQNCIENMYLSDVFNVNNAGTAFRFLTALFSIIPGTRKLSGSKRMMYRPVGNLVNALIKLGADITYNGRKNFPPLTIKGNYFTKNTVSLSAGMSSQFISALLLIAPELPNGIQIKLSGNIASKPYIEMTLKMMEQFDVRHHWKKNIITIEKQSYAGHNFIVEADWSAAAFWYQIVALSQNATVELKGLTNNSLQGDSVVAIIFDKLGVKTSFLPDSVLLTNKPKSIIVFTHDFFNTPDLFPPILATCTALNVPFRFTGLQNLVIKESDRISAMITELAKFGYYFNYDQETATMDYDGNKGTLRETDILCDSHNDHRIAMSLAPMALLSCGINLTGSECVSKSYPGYFADLKTAGFVIDS